ncbi:trafficking protein particle complex subunit 11 [Dendroctonus ponderosae]|uniref:trafficking protein particle complex subunit 11 n=1 Tax=Dendroctonus ponderosae TaxID=77166 RepID=UPI0020359733|nr:trafficking protein particle complex subunit 11 [Dendroctonus ponderosae]KAH1003355.1 hypothetical protein HUJ05_011279 [Dendroctonus ponderosae]
MALQGALAQYQASMGLPAELRAAPLALVGFSGLDLVNNAIHKAIWDTFHNRSERGAVLYQSISNTHKFPVLKPRRNTYDWYIPKGILKRNWLAKHLQQVPALIAVFFDLDWKEPQWTEKMIECASKVQSMRAALEGRDTCIVVVLIQSQAPMPEDPLAAERAVALCSSCELNSQSLYVLPHGQHLSGYATRLENAFLELCQAYYHSCVRSIKQHKEHLNKNAHQSLYVRHQFKMGVLSELRQDISAAHKHYTLAYSNLQEIRVVDTNALEVRTVAGFLNYKICRLLFALNLPRDAIGQFKAHIDRFRARIGFSELVFEHWAWLSKQYEIFGDTFDEAVKLGLPAVQTQHPGIYYQQAATLAVARKGACLELCARALAYPHPDPLEGAESMEFYGQRPWRPGKVAAEPPEPQWESSGIQAIQYLESQINHSGVIISLYGLAIAQYKIYKCPRTRRHLVLQMADECFSAQDYGKALTLYTHMLADYRAEQWWGVISSILEKAALCAYLTANVEDYLQLALEILAAPVLLSLDDKRRFYENFNRVLKRQVPFGDPKLAHEALQTAIIQWQPVLGGAALSPALDIAQACLDVKWRFASPAFPVDQAAQLVLFIRSTCPFPLGATRVAVQVATARASWDLDVCQAVTFQRDAIQRFTVEVQAEVADIGCELLVEGVTVFMGVAGQSEVSLRFRPPEGADERPELSHFRRSRPVGHFDAMQSVSRALVVPRDSHLGVRFEHAPPALVGEVYDIAIVIANEEACAISELRLLVSAEAAVEFSSDASMRPEKTPLALPLPPTLEPGGVATARLWLRASQPDIKAVAVRISYSLTGERPVVCVMNDSVTLPIVQPFEVSAQYLSGMMQRVSKFYAGERFAVMPLVRFLSPWPISVEGTALEFTHPVRALEDAQSHLAGSVFNQDEVGTEVVLAVCDRQADQNLVVGEYAVTWQRANGRPTTTQVTLHGHHCDWIPLTLELQAPAHGLVRTPMIIQYQLTNQSSHLVRLDVGMEASEAFMFAGYRQTVAAVLPFSTKTLRYNLYPLLAGSVALPRLVLSLPQHGNEGPALRPDQLAQLIERTIPCSIYVMPQVKGAPPLPALTA